MYMFAAIESSSYMYVRKLELDEMCERASLAALLRDIRLDRQLREARAGTVTEEGEEKRRREYWIGRTDRVWSGL